MSVLFKKYYVLTKHFRTDSPSPENGGKTTFIEKVLLERVVECRK